jgi:uncharacterized membrane protein YsdA (DUF1294 family)
MNDGSFFVYVWDNNTAKRKMEEVPEKINAQLSIAATVLEFPPMVLQLGWP